MRLSCALKPMALSVPPLSQPYHHELHEDLSEGFNPARAIGRRKEMMAERGMSSSRRP